MEGFLVLGSLSIGFSAAWDLAARTLTGGLTVQWDSPMASVVTRGRRTTRGYTHSQSLFGSIAWGSDLVFGRAGHQQSAAVLRIFEDTNLDGVRNAGERLLPHVEAQIFNAGWVRRPTGDLHAGHLEAYVQYQVRILESSVHDPLLSPVPGWDFSFTADPGRTKVIAVAMQRLPRVLGQITGLDRAPSRLRVVAGDTIAEVYRDGGFTLRLRPGHSSLKVVDLLTGETLTSRVVDVAMGTNMLEIPLEGQGQ